MPPESRWTHRLPLYVGILLAVGCGSEAPTTPDPSGPADTDRSPSAQPSPTQDDRFGPPPDFPDGEQVVAELFTGVRLLSRSTKTPRPLRYHLVQLDPTADGLSFVTTAPHGPDLPRQTTRQTTRAFLEEHSLQLAINTHFFKPWPAEDAYADLIGLAAHQGQIFNAFQPNWEQAFVIDIDGAAHIVEKDPADPDGKTPRPPVSIQEAVGTNERIVRDGQNTATWTDLHPRTAVGVTEVGHVIFAIVDGRQEGTSEGMSTLEVADILIEVGVVDGINLDGGGSTTLVVADPEPRLVNTPIGILVPGTERRVGSNLGVRAQPW